MGPVGSKMGSLRSQVVTVGVSGGTSGGLYAVLGGGCVGSQDVFRWPLRALTVGCSRSRVSNINTS